MFLTRSWWRAVLSYTVGALLALQGLGLLVPTATHAASPEIQLNEINWAGSDADPQDQWLELVNVSGGAIDFSVTPYTLVIQTTVPETIHLDASYGTLADHQLLLISRQDPAVDSTLQTLAGVMYHQESTLDLPTVATEYDLYNDLDLITPVDQVPVTQFAGTAATATTNAASMSRKPVLSSTLPPVWYTAVTIGAGFDAAAPEQYGTPGNLNFELTTGFGFVMPAGSVTLPAFPTVHGKTTGPTTSATTRFKRISHSPAPYKKEYTGPITGGTFSIDADVPPLIAGRYDITAFAFDANGSRSQDTRVPSSPGDPDSNYMVLPASSTVPMPMLNALPALTNQHEVMVAGTLDSSTVYDSLEVMLNGAYYGTFNPSGSTFNFPVILKLNQSNLIQVIGVEDSTGSFSMPASATVVNDSIVPNPVDLSKVTLHANPPGSHDDFLGQPGAAEAATTLYVYGDVALTKLLATLTVAGDGSFAMVDIGDNKYSSVYLVLQDAAGNRSSTAKLDNPTGFNTPPGALSPLVTDVQQTQVTVSWTKVTDAKKYRVKYKVAGGSYGTPTELCLTGNATCAFTTTVTGLFTDTDYVLAVAAVDVYGNESAYEEVAFHTKAAPPPAPIAAIIETIVPKAKAATRAVDKVTKVEATPTPVPDKGEVKSEETVARNWTPWIVLGALVAIAILATFGYFYWFGGEAGEAALASVMAERAKREEEEEEKNKSGGGKPKGRSSKDRRW